MILLPWGASFALNQAHPVHLMLKVTSIGQKIKLEQEVETHLSIQCKHVACALLIVLAAHSPSNGIPILHFENKFSGLL